MSSFNCHQLSERFGFVWGGHQSKGEEKTRILKESDDINVPWPPPSHRVFINSHRRHDHLFSSLHTPHFWPFWIPEHSPASSRRQLPTPRMTGREGRKLRYSFYSRSLWGLISRRKGWRETEALSMRKWSKSDCGLLDEICERFRYAMVGVFSLFWSKRRVFFLPLLPWRFDFWLYVILCLHLS